MNNNSVLVTGGGGFVGMALCKKLREQGRTVLSLSRKTYPELEKIGVKSICCDLSSPEDLGQYLNGVETVFHVAARVGLWGRYKDFYRTNVEGTTFLLEAAQRAGVKKFIYTSSPSVIADGTDLKGVDESYQYPDHHEAHYPATKAIAEKRVLEANSDNFYTLSLRPHLIWGPGDRNLIPTILQRAKQKKLVQVGDGKNQTDVCYIEDCIAAHLCAEKALEENPDSRGRSYFISQGEPVLMWSWINEILKRNGYQPIQKSIPVGLAKFVAKICEGYSKLHPRYPEPRLSSFLVTEMSTDHYFDISAARKELGFQPQYSVAEAMDLTFSN